MSRTNSLTRRQAIAAGAAATAIAVPVPAHAVPSPVEQPVFDDDPLKDGWRAAKWLPFDARLYLERCLAIGAPVWLFKDSFESHIWLGFPETATPPEWEFLTGWRNGSEGSTAQIIRELKRNTRLARAHRAASYGKART